MRLIKPSFLRNLQKAVRPLQNQRGTVTIYLVIIFTSLLLVIGLLIDAARIKITQNKLRGAANASARSVLAEYNDSLRKSYGLFGASPSNYQQDFDRYIQLNLKDSQGQNFKLLDMRVEDSAIYMSRPLKDTKAFKQQILEDMKYRGPIEITKKLVEKLAAIKRVAKASANELKKGQDQKAVNGSLQQLKNKNSQLKNQKNRLQSLKSQLKELDSAIKAKEAEIKREKTPQKAATLSQELAKLNHDKSQNESELKVLLKDMEGILNEAKALRTQMQQSLDRMEQLQRMQQETARQPLEKTEDSQVRDQVQTISDNGEGQIAKLKADLQKLDANLQTSQKAYINYINSNSGDEGLLDQINLDSSDALFNDVNNSSYAEGGMSEKDSLRTEMAKYQKKFNQTYQDKAIPFTVINNSSVNSYEADENDRLAQDNASFLEDILQAADLENLFTNARDKILINEYALNYFSYLTGPPKGGGVYPYQNSEVEYFLYGGKYPEVQALANLYKTRFALDTAGYLVYSPIPEPLVRIVESLVMGALTGAVDTLKLATGEDVPIITMYPANPLDKAGLKLNYLDHLRLFLLMDNQPEEERLKKLLRLINLRSGQPVANAPTLIDGRVEVSIKMWFLPLASFKNMKGPFGTEIRQGRCYIAKDVEYSY